MRTRIGPGASPSQCLSGGPERARRSREGDEEGIPLRVDLDAPDRPRTPHAGHGDAPPAPARTPRRPSSCSSFVDPSTSVKRKVTVPVGRSVRTARSSARQDPASSHARGPERCTPKQACSHFMRYPSRRMKRERKDPRPHPTPAGDGRLKGLLDPRPRGRAPAQRSTCSVTGRTPQAQGEDSSRFGRDISSGASGLRAPRRDRKIVSGSG